MQWVAPTEKDTVKDALKQRLWAAADQFRMNSSLRFHKYSAPVLGLTFLCFAKVCFISQRLEFEKKASSARRGSRIDDPATYHADTRACVVPDDIFPTCISQHFSFIRVDSKICSFECFSVILHLKCNIRSRKSYPRTTIFSKNASGALNIEKTGPCPLSRTIRPIPFFRLRKIQTNGFVTR